MPPKKETAAPIAVDPNALKGKKCIITGEIEGRSRKAAEEILTNAGATIEKSLNKKVELVVLGQNAGPSKLEKIEKLGIETKEWDELIEEIRGEGGEEADGAKDDDDEEMHDEEQEEEEEPEEKPKPKPKPKSKAAPKATANTKAKAAPAAAKPKPAASSGDFSLDGKTVLITGTIPGHTRNSAQEVVEEAGATHAKSLNKSVELVILGTTPGPDKLSKIEDLGIETMKWAELAEHLGFEAAPEKKVAEVATGDAPDSIDGLTIIITGTIEGQTRSKAQKLLEGAGATFAKSLNNSVELVVLGTNPGPDKLNKIADLGIATTSFEALTEKLGLEAEASEPPKKRAKKN